jgi:hypothetical protein
MDSTRLASGQAFSPLYLTVGAGLVPTLEFVHFGLRAKYQLTTALARLREKGGREAVGGAPESALGRRGEGPLQVDVSCNRLRLRRRETGWRAPGGERLVHRITNSIRPTCSGESATLWRSPESPRPALQSLSCS